MFIEQVSHPVRALLVRGGHAMANGMCGCLCLRFPNIKCSVEMPQDRVDRSLPEEQQAEALRKWTETPEHRPVPLHHLRLSLPPIHLLRRLEAPRDTCGAPLHNQVAAGVENFKLNGIGELVGIII